MQSYESEYETLVETPFFEPRVSHEEPQRELATLSESDPGRSWEFETPFETGELSEQGESAMAAPEVAAFTEVVSDLKDHLFRESLEALATEALELHTEQLAGEYGDREQRDASSERLLNDHFAPLAAQMEASLDRLFERFETYEVAALTEAEVERVVSEIAPASNPFAPASEQFLGGFLRKAGRLVSGAVRAVRSGVQGAVSLAGKGLSALGKLALGPLLKGLKALGLFLLKHVVKFALGNLPPALQPMARQLSDRLFRSLGETHESESEHADEAEAGAVSAGVDVARLEAEFDVAAAQLLSTADEAEAEFLAQSYGEAAPDRSLGELDDARARLVNELKSLETGESPQPVMEQFLPAMLWPVAKTAITLMGRPKLVAVIGKLLSGLVRPMIGAKPAALLAPAIADAGLRIFGLEAASGETDPRALTAEALAATVEETVNRIAELPRSTFENETLLESAVNEAFEDAASTYFPNAYIKPELREAFDQRGVWMRMPGATHRKRYSKYSDSVPVSITPRVAESVRTFGNATLRDHLRDRMDVSDTQPLQTQVRLYQVLPGATTSSIARAEGIHPRDLHPLTPQAAGALLGPNAAGLGPRASLPGSQIATPHRLHLRQRLYYIEPPNGRKHQLRPHARLARSEVSINLAKGQFKLWFYLSEPLAQKVAVELAKPRGAAGAFRMVQPLIGRAAELLKSSLQVRRLPPALRIVGETAELEHRPPPWLSTVGAQLSSKVAEWASNQVAHYLRNNVEQFRKLSASDKDGVTLRITMSRIPGIEVLRQLSNGRTPGGIQGSGWLRGEPAFEVVAVAGYALQ